MATGTSTVRRRRLGSELRRCREVASLKHEDAAAHLVCSQGKISQIENGRTGLKKFELIALLDLYDVTGDTRDELVEMRTQASKTGWWHAYTSVLPAGFGTYVDLESEASSVSAYEGLLVHGLLQTEAYMHALVEGNLPESTTTDVDRFVGLRLARQQAITRNDSPLKLWMVLDEAAVRRVVGGSDIMRHQVEHLIEFARLPNLSIQVLPFARGSHAGLRGSFSVFDFPHTADPQVVYVDCPAGNIYLEENTHVRDHQSRFSHLQVAALDQRSTVRLLDEVAKELS